MGGLVCFRLSGVRGRSHDFYIGFRCSPNLWVGPFVSTDSSPPQTICSLLLFLIFSFIAFLSFLFVLLSFLGFSCLVCLLFFLERLINISQTFLNILSFFGGFPVLILFQNPILLSLLYFISCCVLLVQHQCFVFKSDNLKDTSVW